MTPKELAYWICGLDLKYNHVSFDNIQDENENHFVAIDISQTRYESLFCNVNAIKLMCLAGFLWAFFNKFN